MEKFACAYIRKSTEEQSVFSLQSQTDYCKREAKARGLTLPAENIFIDDGFSAKTTNRPALIKMLALCQRKKTNITAIIVYKIDRLSRETADYLGLRKILASKGITVVSCTEPADDTPAGEFIETILAAAAKYDNAIKSERVTANMLLRVKSGYPSGGKAPLGYMNGIGVDGRKTYLKDPKTWDHVRAAWLAMETGNYSFERIAKHLADAGVVKNNKKINKQTLGGIFSNKTYCGYVVSKAHGFELKSDKIPQMISEDTYFRVRAIVMKRNNSPTVYQKVRPEFPLRGFLVCEICQQSLRAGFSKGRSKYYAYYWCQDHAKPSISSDKADEALLNLLRTLTPDPLLRKIFLEDVKRKWNEKYRDFAKQQEKVKTQIEDLKELQHRIAKKNYEGLFTDEFTKEELSKVDAEIFTYQTILSESKLAQLDIEVLISFMNAFLEDLGKVYLQEESLELRRFMLGSIFSQKLIYKNGNLEPLGLALGFEVLSRLSGDSSNATVQNCGQHYSQIEPIILDFEKIRQAFVASKYFQQFAYL